MTKLAREFSKMNTPVQLDAYIKDINSNESQDTLTITGFANTISKDRAGDVIVASAWTTSNALKNYMKNPIILFGHDHSRPIGKCVDLYPTEMGLQITVEIFKGADPAIFDLIKNGVLRTFSVGFRILDADWDDDTNTFMILDLELFEVSVVSVPCNQDSTFTLAKSMNGENFLELRKLFIKSGSDATEPKPTKAISETEKLCRALGFVQQRNK